MLKMKKTAFAVVATLLAATSAWSQDPVLNLYSARHYSTDEALYANFTKTTGIKINRVDADDAGILARLKAEGAASPADVILLVDAARLWKGEIEGLFQPVKSKILEEAIPAPLRAKPASEGGTTNSKCATSKVASGGFQLRRRLRLRVKRKRGQ